MEDFFLIVYITIKLVICVSFDNTRCKIYLKTLCIGFLKQLTQNKLKKINSVSIVGKLTQICVDYVPQSKANLHWFF